MSSSKDVTFKLKCEVDDGATKSIDALSARLEKLHKLTKLKLEFDISDAESKLSKIEKQLDELQAKANIKIRTTQSKGTSSRSSKTSTQTSRQTGRMRTPSRPRNSPDTRTGTKPASTAKPTVQPRNRAGAAKATASRNTKAPASRGGGLIRKPIRGRAGAALGLVSMASGFLTLPQNNGGSGPEAAGGSADEYEDMQPTERELDLGRTERILAMGSEGARNLTENMSARDASNVNTTIEAATTLGMAGAGYTAATGATILGAGVGTVATGAVLAGGAGFAAGNFVGRRISGQEEAEAELAKNLEQEQRMIDNSGAVRSQYSKQNESNLSKIEKERAAGFRTASKSDVDEFAADKKSIAGSQEERLASIESLQSKNESQRDAAAKEAARLSEVLVMSEKAGENTSFGMQADGIRKDLEAQNKILQQQEQQLKTLADERLKIEKEIAKTRTETTDQVSKAEESTTSKESTNKNSKDMGAQMANSVEKKLREVVDHFDEKIADLKLVDSNVRNGG
jgi:hypothetical protein